MVMASLAVAAAGAAIKGVSGAMAAKKRRNRDEQSYGDMQDQYGQSKDELQQGFYDQSMNQQMALARSGGTAASQASGQQQAMLTAPMVQQQAGLAAHQGALNYAGMAGDYRQGQLREDIYDQGATYGKAEQGVAQFGRSAGGGIAAAGAMMSDERTKEFNGRVGRDIGTPEMYPASDKRAKELDTREKTLNQQFAELNQMQQAFDRGQPGAMRNTGMRTGDPRSPQGGIDQQFQELAKMQKAHDQGRSIPGGYSPAGRGAGNDVVYEMGITDNSRALPNSGEVPGYTGPRGPAPQPQPGMQQPQAPQPGAPGQSGDPSQPGGKYGDLREDGSFIPKTGPFQSDQGLYSDRLKTIGGGANYQSEFKTPESYLKMLEEGRVDTTIDGRYDNLAGNGFGGYDENGPTPSLQPADVGWGVETGGASTPQPGMGVGTAPGQVPKEIASMAGQPQTHEEMQALQARQKDELLRGQAAGQAAEDESMREFMRSQGMVVPGEEASAPPKPAPRRRAERTAMLSSQPGVTPQEAAKAQVLAEPPPVRQGTTDRSYPNPYAQEPEPLGQYDPSIPGFAASAALRDSAYRTYEPGMGSGDPYPGFTAGTENKIQADWEREEKRKLRSRNPNIAPYSSYGAASDEDMKSTKGKMPASAIFEETPGYSYHYKDEYQGAPGTKPGQHMGIMAQDLEKTPEGASMVDEDEMGMKHVDTDRLSMANSAALSEILQRLKSLEGGARG